MATESSVGADLSKLLIVLPNWVGDVVLATPALRAIREHLPKSEITYLMRPYVQDVLHDCPWMDDVVLWPEGAGRRRTGILGLAAELRKRRFTDVLLLTNSFRTALLSWLARVPRRIGYARDYRSWLLTDRVEVPRENGAFRIESMLVYYDRLARWIGCPDTNGRLQLFADEQSEAEIEQWWQEFEICADQTVVVINPGSSFGSSKLYPVDRFAKVADVLASDCDAKILITAGPREIGMAESVKSAMTKQAVVVSPPRLNLRRVKSLIKRCDLLITNDTGPRHFAIAFDVPVVTIFGSTHPGWTETHYELERQISIPVDCGPCQKAVCPLDHRCMTGISPEMVLHQARELLSLRGRPSYV